MESVAEITFNTSLQIIKTALEIAIKVHEGQLDKGGNPYIGHPIFVANKMQTTNEIVVALLHDVCEDSEVTFDNLEKSGFSSEIVSAIKAITKIKGEKYGDYLERVKHNKIASLVKIEDMKHNSDLSRLKSLSEEDLKRKEKYLLSINNLSSFTCKVCKKVFNVEQMGDKKTRNDEIVCIDCLSEYEINWDNYEDWCNGE
jgi:(p)ppGpp synthase/HD superfamily hydrolase